MCLSSFLVLGIFVLSTNPRDLSAALLLVLPLLVYLTVYSASRLTANYFFSTSKIRVHSVSAIIAAGPTLMVILGSLGQLGVQDILLACMLCAGLGWYLRRLPRATQRDLALARQ